jgi:hypothetical protein
VSWTILDAPTWRARRAEHEARVDSWVAGHAERRRHGRKHPVEDFLFTYYSYRPNALRRWHPGVGVALEAADPAEFGPDYTTSDGTVRVDVDAVRQRRGEAVRWIGTLLRRTAGRPAHFGCFGMHEWAMVYRSDDVRHTDWPLRLSPAGTDAVLDANRVRCSHFDAYRFFTEPARGLNLLRPTRETQADLDQPGCLHVSMDLYKWAYKLAPLTSSDLIADCFALTREVRALDMRASPYDLADLGYPPVRVETPEGRAEYAAAQRGFADRAAPLRDRLITVVSGTVVSGDDVDRPGDHQRHGHE